MLSIAMATYNGEKYVQEQIDSILEQTYRDFELIICDDCSTDNTLKVIQEFCSNDVRIYVYKNEKRLGYIKNFEKALCLCHGDYIALSDQDDIWEPTHLEFLYKNIGESLLICSNALLVDTNNISLNSTMKDVIHIKYIPCDHHLIFQRLLYMNFAQGSSMLISRELLDKAVPFPFEIPHDYWLAIVAASESKLVYSDFITLRYRQHTGNITDNKKTPPLKRFFSKNMFNQSNVLHTVYARLILENDFMILFNEANLLYAEDDKLIDKFKKITTMFSIYQRINFNKSVFLLLYRIFRFSFLKLIRQ
jgi:glycosyltransferase involved in cell wall biosynthesis